MKKFFTKAATLVAVIALLGSVACGGSSPTPDITGGTGSIESIIGFSVDIIVSGSDGVNNISQSGNVNPASITFTVEEFDGSWFVDGVQAAAGNSIEIVAASYSEGPHIASFIAAIEGISYSKQVPFNVTK